MSSKLRPVPVPVPVPKRQSINATRVPPSVTVVPVPPKGGEPGTAVTDKTATGSGNHSEPLGTTQPIKQGEAR